MSLPFPFEHFYISLKKHCCVLLQQKDNFNLLEGAYST